MLACCGGHCATTCCRNSTRTWVAMSAGFAAASIVAFTAAIRISWAPVKARALRERQHTISLHTIADHSEKHAFVHAKTHHRNNDVLCTSEMHILMFYYVGRTLKIAQQRNRSTRTKNITRCCNMKSTHTLSYIHEICARMWLQCAHIWWDVEYWKSSQKTFRFQHFHLHYFMFDLNFNYSFDLLEKRSRIEDRTLSSIRERFMNDLWPQQNPFTELRRCSIAQVRNPKTMINTSHICAAHCCDYCRWLFADVVQRLGKYIYMHVYRHMAIYFRHTAWFTYPITWKRWCCSNASWCWCRMQLL